MMVKQPGGPACRIAPKLRGERRKGWTKSLRVSLAPVSGKLYGVITLLGSDDLPLATKPSQTRAYE